MKISRLLALLSLACLISLNTSAQKKMSLEQIIGGSFRQISSASEMRSSSDGDHYTAMNEDGSMILKYEYQSGGIIDTLFNTSAIETCSFEDFESYDISDNGKMILIYRDSEPIYRHSSRQKVYVYSTENGTLEPLSRDKEKVMIPTLSPDNSACAFVFENNIYIRYFDREEDVLVSHDGKINHIINGTTDWVYEEEFAVTNLMCWSSDSQTLAWVRFDESEVKEYSMAMYGDEKYPESYDFKYPKVGEDNSKVSVHAYNTRTQETMNLTITSPAPEYIPRIAFTEQGDRLAVSTLNRLQNCFQLYYIDPLSGASELVFEDTNERYVDSEWIARLMFIDGGFLYVSERDKFAHIYRYDDKKQQLSQITSGEWDVTDLIGYDPVGKTIYYESAEESPLVRHIYSISSRGKKTKLSSEEGTNGAVFNSNFSYYTAYHSSASEPMTISVVEIKSGKQLRTLVDNSALRDSLMGYSYAQKEFFTLTTKSNQRLNAWIIKPVDFDPEKSYPMLMVQYSGPNSQQVLDDFSIGWEQHLVDQGIIVACVDGRGTGARGEEFRKCTYLTMGLLESQDQIEAAQALSELPYIDADRMAIWGWSFGGYNTLLALSRGEGTFKVGIAVAPVTDWRYYDTVYTERFMRTNKENQHGYDISSPMMLAGDLEGKLLLIHGTADDNVHFKQSLDYAEKLVQAGKQFDMFVYRDRNHSIYGGNTRQHLYRKMADYLKENL